MNQMLGTTLAALLSFVAFTAGGWAIFEKGGFENGAREYQRYLDKVNRLKIFSVSMLVIAYFLAAESGAYPPNPKYALLVFFPAIVFGYLIARIHGLNETLSISPSKMEVLTAVTLGFVIITAFWKYFPISAG